MTNTIDPEIIKQLMRDYKYGANHLIKTSSYKPSTESASIVYGMDLYNSYSPKVRDAIKSNRKYWADALESRYGTKNIPVTNSKGEVVYTVDLDKFLTTKDYNDINSRYVNGLMLKLYPNQIEENIYKIDPNTGLILKNKKGEKIKVDSPDDQLAINSGDNIYYNMMISYPQKNVSRLVPEEWEDLKILGLNSYKNDKNHNKSWSRHEGENNDVYYDFFENNGSGYSKPTITLVYDKNKGTWQQYSYDGNGNGNVRDVMDISSYRGKNLSAFEDTPEGNNLMNERFKILDDRNRNNHKSQDNNQIVFMHGNSKGVGFNNGLAEGVWSGTEKREKALGGPTTRIYAVGGLTGDQIPIGEQPNDYNMINEGGKHEENPMGGVPYGINQDGSQNMVEEGEVSVGNNVFSDRTALSPELCQQLGLPEGTTPAQAMQQIEALYEQGQIGDEEFQEVQEIIFEDQEMQKQNVGESYQQGEVGGEGIPQEGITPDMMQGSSMPPETMQDGMQPIPQQGAPIPQTEGIQPEMVQGGMYGCGGYMKRW